MRTSLITLAVLLLAAPVAAQPVPSRDPGSTHIFPAGAQRGTTVRVRVGTECAPPGVRLHWYGEGVSGTEILETPAEARGVYEPSVRRRPTEVPISHPREWDAELEISADAEPGPRLWRISCGQGGSRARPFVVGDLPEFIETESNSLPERAQRVALPVTVNGQIAGERDLDYFLFRAEAGQTVVCDVVCGRLGSPLEPRIEIDDPRGDRVPLSRTFVGSDPVLAFCAPQTGDYRLLVANLETFGGPEYVYRLTLTAGGYATLAFPPAAAAGTTREVEFLLAAADGLRSVREQVAFPQQPGPFLHRGAAADNAMELSAAAEPPQLEAEPSDEPAQAATLPPGTQLFGRFAAPGDRDWYRFAAQKGQRLAFRCEAATQASAAQPALSLHDAGGEQLASAISFAAPDGVCRIEWTAPAAGEFFVQARDAQSGAGGPQFVYRLQIDESRPDFELSLARDAENVVPGEKLSLQIDARRLGGFDGPIAIDVQDLPEGVAIDGKAEIPQGKSSAKVTLKAADDARPGPHDVRVIGRAETEGAHFERTASAPHAGRCAAGTSVGSGRVERLLLTVRHKPVYRLHCLEAYQYAHRGTVYPYLMTVERLDGYDGEIVLQIGDRQNRDLDGIQMFEITVPAGQGEALMPIYLPETMHINVQSQSQLYVQSYTRFTDRWGQLQSLLVVSEKRCMIRSMPTLVKLQPAEDAPVALLPGETTVCRLHLERTPNYPGAMQLELIDPPPGITAEPVEIAAGQTDIQVQLHAAADMRPPAAEHLRFRANGPLPKHLRVVTEASVPLK